MLKTLSDGLMAGLGAVLLTKDKVQEVTQRLVDEAKLSKQEAARLNKELLEKGESQWKSVEERLQQAMVAGRDRLGLVRQEEVERLSARVEDLEKKVSLLESLVAQLSASGRGAPEAETK